MSEVANNDLIARSRQPVITFHVDEACPSRLSVHTGATSARMLLSSEYRRVQQRTQRTSDHHLALLSWCCQLVDGSSGAARASSGGLVGDTGLVALGVSTATLSLFSADMVSAA